MLPLVLPLIKLIYFKAIYKLLSSNISLYLWYLITPEKFNNKNYIKSFYKKEIFKVGIPYLVFSIIDFILNGNLRHASLTKKLFFLFNRSVIQYIII